jgi:hypothetical protein
MASNPRSPVWDGIFRAPRSSVQGPSLPRERSSIPPKRRGRSGACYMGFARPQPGSEPLSLPSAGGATPRQKGGHEQLSRKRAQKQANEALMAASKDRSGCGAKLSNTVYLMPTTSFIRHPRPQLSGATDPSRVRYAHTMPAGRAGDRARRRGFLHSTVTTARSWARKRSTSVSEHAGLLVSRGFCELGAARFNLTWTNSAGDPRHLRSSPSPSCLKSRSSTPRFVPSARITI